ncbi:MAG TPA: nuclear transport factor 2 family protein [Streptosporangiaceae bacterium]|nr:nuclear transport factor 2 family protein [Streptosporangiaceae bacterium]
MTETDVLQHLAGRLDRLESEQAIRETMVRYAQTLDYGDSAGWAACYTADGVFDVRRRGEPLFRHEGSQALAAFADGHTSAPAVYHKHFLGLPSITVAEDGKSASASTYFMMVHESPDGPHVLVFGRYLDEFARSEDAGWQLAERVVDMEDVGTRTLP